MNTNSTTRREFLTAVGIGAVIAGRVGGAGARRVRGSPVVPRDFFVRPDELTLKWANGPAKRRLSFARYKGSAEAWRQACWEKLVELLGFATPPGCEARLLRSAKYGNVTIEAWVMDVSESVSIPAYLLRPETTRRPGRAVMAIHGHGEAEACVGLYDDYHHRFALELAKAGHVVLCPALRGFGALGDMALGDKGRCLDYWRSSRGRQFTLVSDALLYGQTLIGQTVADLLRWEMWLDQAKGIRRIDAAGISYGGDLALIYPLFSSAVDKIYASGSLGSFSAVFSRCYNAPGHCIPGILDWMDRSDIAGLNARRPIRLHYGQKDTPGPQNNSASYNETAEPSLVELRAIYKAFDAEEKVSMHVTPDIGHEMDNGDLIAFLAS